MYWVAIGWLVEASTVVIIDVLIKGNVMITYKKGNAVSALIDGEIDYLLNCVNCQGRYASGIAKEIRERIPSAYRRYEDFCRQYKGRMLGDLAIDYSGVVHLAAQEFYGYDKKRYVNYGALSSCLFKFKDCTKFRYCSLPVKLGIPYGICSGLAGGDWNIVLELIEFILKDFDVIIYELENN
jgi:hypothetical protein